MKNDNFTSCFDSNLSNAQTRPLRFEAPLFYHTSSMEYHSDWKITQNMSIKDFQLPVASEVLARRKKCTVKYPVPLNVDKSKFPLQNASQEIIQDRNAYPVAYTHIVPQKFPPYQTSFKYPPSKESNPFYKTTLSQIGEQPPQKHQILEKYFPHNNNFTREFTVTHQRFSGLNTTMDKSRV